MRSTSAWRCPARRRSSWRRTSATRCTACAARSPPAACSSPPAFVLLCAMSAVYVEYGEVASVAGVVRGLGAAVIALVAAAVLRVGSRVIHTAAALAMAALAFVLIVAGLPFPVILVLAALAGYLAGRRNPTLLGRPAGHGDADDDAETAVPQTGLRRRIVKSLAIWLDPGRPAAPGRRLRRPAHRLLHDRSPDHVRRRLRRPAVRRQRRGQPLRLADRPGHGRRAWRSASRRQGR